MIQIRNFELISYNIKTLPRLYFEYCYSATNVPYLQLPKKDKLDAMTNYIVN